MTNSDKKPRLLPTGNCWCGCGKEVGLGKFFAAGHDKAAESALIALNYGGSVPEFLHAHGYGPQRSVSHAAVEASVWTRCEHCDYMGAEASVRNHTRKHHPDQQ
ncbi:hypothetical protein ACFW81_24180 [Streptomyces angustmyceticus]|uniref:hypothetical protein n=1 Tax=Streptomyces angustmyceticus TaxID=285578 RepID=UPI003679B7A9